MFNLLVQLLCVLALSVLVVGVGSTVVYIFTCDVSDATTIVFAIVSIAIAYSVSIAALFVYVIGWLFITIKYVVSIKNNAIAILLQDFWNAEYFKNIVFDNTMVQIDISKNDAKELIDVIFIDAINEDRQLDSVEMSMLKELINNCSYCHDSKLAYDIINDLIAVEERFSFELKYANSWIKQLIA